MVETQPTLGNIKVTFIHTPGHTPGSNRFLVENCLVAGDTMSIRSCGRVDLPGSNPEDMYYSLQTLSKLADETIRTGHNYADNLRIPSLLSDGIRRLSGVVVARIEDGFVCEF